MPAEAADPQASLIGVAIACAGNILISLALTIQKLAHKREAAKALAAAVNASTLSTSKLTSRRGSSNYGLIEVDPLTPLPAPATLPRNGNGNGNGNGCDSPSASPPPSELREGAYLRSRLWWLGLGMMAIGEAGNFLSYGFAPASVVAPLGTVALVANCVFAPLILGESFTARNVLGMLLAILGAVTVVWSSKDSNKRMSPDELWAAIMAPVFLAYTAVNAALVTLLSYLSSQHGWGDKYIGIDVGTCALFGGYTVMATKALSSLVSTKFLAALKYPIAWAAIVVLVVTSVFQIKFLNRALMRFDSKEVIPTQFVFFSLAAIVGSSVLYQELSGVSFSHFVNFAFGIATTFLGVYFLTTPPTEAASVPPRTLDIVDEEAPLLTPQRGPSVPSLVPASSTATATAVPLPAAVGRLIHKRPSQPNIAMGINSQGSLLLLATTPPVTPVGRDRSASLGRAFGALNRVRSGSRSTLEGGEPVRSFSVSSGRR